MRFILTTICTAFILSCSPNNEDNLSGQDYAVLFPKCVPYNGVELDGKLYALYDEYFSEAYPDKTWYSAFYISTFSKDRVLKNRLTKGFENSALDELMFIENGVIYLYYYHGNDLNLMKLDESGNILEERGIVNNGYNWVSLDQGQIFLMRSDQNSIYLDIYTLDGDLIKTDVFVHDMGDGYIEKLIVKDGLIYVQGPVDQRVINYRYEWENHLYQVFKNGKAISRFKIKNEDRNVLPMKNGNLFFVNKHPQNNTWEVAIYNQIGDELYSKLFYSSSGLFPFINRGGEIVLLSGNKDFLEKNVKSSVITVLTPQLEIKSEKNFGGYDRGTSFDNIIEGENHYYIMGRTLGTTGDFDLSNNSEEVDMFVYTTSK